MRPEGEQPEFWIAGRAPLPVFAHLGSELSAWATPPVLLNRRKDGVWDIVTTGATANDPAVFFDVRTDLASSPAESTGRVAVFVSTLGTPPQRDALRSFVVARGDDLAGIVELRTGGPEYLTGENAGRAAEELAQVVSQLPGAYPHAEGIALFVAGPAHLAFLAGRAINANMLRDVLIPNFRTGEYEDALRLPWRGATPRALSLEPEDEKDRNAVLALLRDGIRGAMDAVEERDVPTFVARAEASAFLKHLRGIDLSDEAQGTAFDLNILQGRLSIGRGLLEALRGIDPADLRRMGAELLFHEVWHFDQNIRSTNYREVGRAGLAIEEVDYRADAVAIGTLARVAARMSGNPRGDLVAHITSAIRCIQAFDRSEQGDRIENLAERRFRRYLIWYLQLCRAATISTVEHIDLLLGERVIVEVAPLRGHLDARYDKLASTGTDMSELFIVLGGRLLRYPPRPGFLPAALVEAVRGYDWTLPQAAMDYVIGENAPVLVPWQAAP